MGVDWKEPSTWAGAAQVEAHGDRLNLIGGPRKCGAGNRSGRNQKKSTSKGFHLASTSPSYSAPYSLDFGDFVSNEDEQVDLECVAEPWHKYDIKETPNVFYPIYLGEVLNGRYLIEHKLGFGGGSTVWMAHDLQRRRDVALEVMSLGDWGANEYRMQEEILKNVQDTSRLVTYLGTFLLPGNQPSVLVFPLIGPCINPVELEKVPMASRMSAARQLLEGLKNLHKAGIVHRGKLE